VERPAGRGQDAILRGTGDKIAFIYDDGCAPTRPTKTFEGVIPTRAALEGNRFRLGARGNRALHVEPRPARPATATGSSPRRWRSRSAAAISARSPSSRSARPTTGSTRCRRSSNEAERDRRRILKEIRERLKFLNDVGLEYLTLSRNSGTLSGGESQRIRLASQIGSGLTGVLYVLDEPSIGLHQRDNARLLETLKHLRDLGNTVIVVEHDEDAILTADYVVDIGPHAGVHGGEIIAQGTPAATSWPIRLADRQVSVRRTRIEVPPERRKS
jgi:excinuclease ABC subunit A